jgi:peptide/nickel transport system ATP-binding protein
VTFEGRKVTGLTGDDLRSVRPRLQLIFQDPISSLNPRRRVAEIVAEPLAIAGIKDGRRERVDAVLDTVGIDPSRMGDRRPHELSGGQCQRVSIARALVQDPKVLICDEPVSALDVSVQAQILNLLEDMKARYGLTMVFISHDLSVVKNISDRVAVMYLGKLCELAPAGDLYRAPLHPYTNALLASIPSADRARSTNGSATRATTGQAALAGELPSPLDPPSGCRFRTRCPRAQAVCAADEPLMQELRPNHFVACHFPVTT